MSDLMTREEILSFDKDSRKAKKQALKIRKTLKFSKDRIDYFLECIELGQRDDKTFQEMLIDEVEEIKNNLSI